MPKNQQNNQPGGNPNPAPATKELKRLDIEGLSIYRDFVNGPLVNNSFDIDVNYNYTGEELVQIFPVWAGGATPKITHVKTSRTNNTVTVQFQTDNPAQVVQVGYILFIVP